MSMVTAQCESLRTIANRLCDDYLFSGFEGARTRGQTIFLAASQMERAADTIENLQEELHHLQACWNFDPCPDCDAQLDAMALRDENAKLRELAMRFADYVGHDRCEGCVTKTSCNEGLIDECWLLTEIREIADGLGIKVDG